MIIGTNDIKGIKNGLQRYLHFSVISVISGIVIICVIVRSGRRKTNVLRMFGTIIAVTGVDADGVMGLKAVVQWRVAKIRRPSGAADGR